MNVVVAGFDATDRATEGLRLAAALAALAGAELIVAAAIEYAPVPMLPTDDYETARSRHFEAVFAKAAEVLAYREFSARELGGAPGGALQACAIDEGADLLVVGSSEHAGLGRIWPGSVPHQLLQGSTCPVAVAPPGYDAGPIERIGVAFNGRKTSWEALGFARELAAESGARIVILSVLPAYLVFDGHLVSEEEMHDRYGAQLADAGKLLADDVEVETRLLPLGDGTVPTLLEACDGLDAIVVGSRGFGPIGRTLLGSVSEPLMRNAPVPVIVAPRPARRPVGWGAASTSLAVG
jgi:nucleotide-binding universal stress UspA family protein